LKNKTRRKTRDPKAALPPVLLTGCWVRPCVEGEALVFG